MHPIYQVEKEDNMTKIGSLQLISPPKRKWSQITRDLVIDLSVVEGTQKVVVLID